VPRGNDALNGGIQGLMGTAMRWGAPPPRRGGGGGGGNYRILGIDIPRPIAWLIATVILMSAFGSLLERVGVPLLSYSVLFVGPVFEGQVWRLLTWAPLELGALGLAFGCLLLYFIGPDLLHRWGTRRFFSIFFGGAVVVGAITCLIGRFVWPQVATVPHFGLWPMEEALIIAWAALYPDRRILLFFALPVSGRNLIGFTIAITVVMAALGGFHQFISHFVAEFLALVYMDVISVRPWIARARLAWFQRAYKRRTAKLTPVDRDPREPPRWTH
jgi:membrane associated rhomboid family serine protease